MHIHKRTTHTHTHTNPCRQLHNYNLTESRRHIRTKFEGEKVINQSQSGSWESRCAGAGLRVNEGPMWGPKTWESITGERPNKTYLSFGTECTQQVEKDRKRKATNEAKTVKGHPN